MPDNQIQYSGPAEMAEAFLPDPPPVPDLRQEVDALIEKNKAGFAELARMGAGIDPANLLNLRIFTLAQLILSEPGLLQFQLRFEQKVAEALQEIRGQIRMAQLAAGAQASPQQVRQMAAAQGLLGPDGKPIQR
jgi:hypothetical protein